MPDAAAARLIEADLDDQFRTQLDPLELLLVLPPARIAATTGTGLVLGQPLAQRRFSAGLMPEQWPTIRSCPGLVVEPEDQRADRACLLARAVTGDHRVDRADALDLDHRRALARCVGGGHALGEDALGPAQPGLGLGRGARPSAPARCRQVAAAPAGAGARQRAPRAATHRPRRAGRRRCSARGSAAESISIREAAGWIRCESASKSSGSSESGSASITISPSST